MNTPNDYFDMLTNEEKPIYSASADYAFQLKYTAKKRWDPIHIQHHQGNS